MGAASPFKICHFFGAKKLAFLGGGGGGAGRPAGAVAGGNWSDLSLFTNARAHARAEALMPQTMALLRGQGGRKEGCEGGGEGGGEGGVCFEERAKGEPAPQSPPAVDT